MDTLAHKAISLILRLGAMMAYKGWVHVIVPFMGRQNDTLRADNNHTMMHMDSAGYGLSDRLLICGIEVWWGRLAWWSK